MFIFSIESRICIIEGTFFPIPFTEFVRIGVSFCKFKTNGIKIQMLHVTRGISYKRDRIIRDRVNHMCVYETK